MIVIIVSILLVNMFADVSLLVKESCTVDDRNPA